MAAQLPAVLLLGWPISPADFARICGNFMVDYGCVALVVALTLQAVEHAADRPGRWPGRWRHTLLVGGLAAAVATQLKPGTSNEFNDSGFAQRVQATGLNTDLDALRLHELWFSAILSGVAAIYLLQRHESIQAEQRRELLEAQWQQARRQVRIMRDATGAARLDPKVLFDCLDLARAEYQRDAHVADALLNRLIEFLRGALSRTRSGPHTLGDEVGLAVHFAAIVAGTGSMPVVDRVPPTLRRLEVCPGIVLPLVQQWLVACAPSLAGAPVQPLRIDAAVEGAGRRLLSLWLSGPVVAHDALLADARTRVAELCGSRATVRAAVRAAATETPQLDILFELPLDAAHAD